VLVAWDGGFEPSDIAEAFFAKTAQLTPPPEGLSPRGVILDATALAGSALPTRVVDVGGAAGAHCLAVRSIISASVRLNWVVVETGEAFDAARRLHHAAEVRFESLLGSARYCLGRTDMPLASGVLMPLPDLHSQLKAFATSGAQTIVFRRTELSANEQTHVIVQELRLRILAPRSFWRFSRITSFEIQTRSFRKQTSKQPSNVITKFASRSPSLVSRFNRHASASIRYDPSTRLKGKIGSTSVLRPTSSSSRHQSSQRSDEHVPCNCGLRE
jgi:putative methyltransferase (TIGR04325 family)